MNRNPNWAALDTSLPTSQRADGLRHVRLGENVPGVGRAGDLVLMASLPSDVRNETEVMDSYLGGYTNAAFAADVLSEPVLVDREAGQRRDFSKENEFEEVDVTAGRDGALKQYDLASELASYRVKPYGLAGFVRWETENDQETNFNIRARTGRMLTKKLALSREIRFWTLATTEANWASTNRTTLGASYQWNTGASKNPRTDLFTRIKASAQPVTAIAMNPEVAFWFLSDTEVRAWMRQMMGDAAPAAGLALEAGRAGGESVKVLNILDLPPIYVCPGKKLYSGSLTYILGDDVVLLCNEPGVPNDGERLKSIITFRYRGRSGTGIVTNEYIPQGRGINGGTMLEVGYSEDMFMGSTIAGGLIKDVLS
jgi:hypothetical protein